MVSPANADRMSNTSYGRHFVLSPIQLNQEAIEGVNGMLNHDRVGVRKIKAILNPELQLIGLLPTMVEPTPFQRANFVQIIKQYHALLIRIGPGPGEFASIPRRFAMAAAQAGRPASRLVVLEDSAHCAHIEETGRNCATVAAFLREHD